MVSGMTYLISSVYYIPTIKSNVVERWITARNELGCVVSEWNLQG